MLIKAKLRNIGNSLGIILPKKVITGFVKGDDIEIDLVDVSETILSEQVKVITPVIKTFIRDYKDSRSCEICGEERISCLQFHHKDASSKLFNISSSSGYTLEDVKEEIKKCLLLCANCHFVLHSEPDVITDIKPSPTDSYGTGEVLLMKGSKLAPDGHPVQHDNSLMVGYVPKG